MIKFPEPTGDFEKVVQKLPNPELEGDSITNWILQGKDTNGSYMYFVARHRISQERARTYRFNKSEKENYSKKSLIHSANKLGGKDHTFKYFQMDNYDGFESQCTVFNEEGLIISRLTMFGEYIFVLGGGGKNVNEDSIIQFLNSFEIIQ